MKFNSSFDKVFKDGKSNLKEPLTGSSIPPADFNNGALILASLSNFILPVTLSSFGNKDSFPGLL